ncbi:MAG: IclR family transcriptional regulator [Rubellimicrobium sp.]|nr:IclR family transcriptional regulator [Rubellimicrobium sp.]
MTVMDPPSGTQSIDRAIGLLSLVGRHSDRGLSLGDLVTATGLNKTTVRRLLLALINAGMVSQGDEDRLYRLGIEAYVLGTFAAPRFGLVETAMESLGRLARKTGDACLVSARRNTNAICLHREEGTYPIRSHVLQKGVEHPLGIGAGSLAMLAALPDHEVEAAMAENWPVIRRDFPQVKAGMIEAGIAATRQKGYAVNPGLIYPNAWAIAMAVTNPDGSLAGALSIAAIDTRMQADRQADLAVLLRQETAAVRLRLERSRPAAERAVTARNRPDGRGGR